MQNNKVKNKVVVLVAALALVVALVGGWMYRIAIKESVGSVFEREVLPTPVDYEAIEKDESKPTTKKVTEEKLLVKDRQEKEQGVSEINLAVPFSPQAPHANWGQPYQDACEEAAVIMTAHYINSTSLTADMMDKEILEMVAWEEKYFGFFKDTNIKETERLVNEYYPGLSAKVKYDITVEDIKQELQRGKAVVVLVNGQKIANPYYTQPGPVKHALVIKGFTNGKFITNDPGTRRGADYVYAEQRLYTAIGDYDGGTDGTGKKAMVVITPKDRS